MSSTAQTSEGEKILIVDDDPGLSNLLVRFISSKGYRATSVTNAADMDRRLAREMYHLVVLDLMLPGEDGLSACRRLRAAGNREPIIMLTAKDSDDDRILGLEIGADDYISKPFNTREVVARVKAVLRRTNASISSQNKQVLEYPNLMINLSEYRVVAFGREITFTAKEMELLWCLASNPGIVFSRNQLLEKIWGYTYYGDTRTVDTHIKRVRHKLDIPPDSTWDIMTVWGVGYKFEVKQ